MENQIFRDINTGLDLNGPILSIVQQPQDVTGIGTTSIRVDGKWIDSANWQQRTVPGVADLPINPENNLTFQTLNYDTLMYGNNLFVTAGLQGYIATSPDGITWTQTPKINPESVFPDAGDSDLTWHGGAFGNGRFVIVGRRDDVNDTPIAASSTDGINWTLVSLKGQDGLHTGLYGVASDGSKFVGISNQYGMAGIVRHNLVTSTDGITWTTIPSSETEEFHTGWMTWGNGVWIIPLGVGSADYLRSTDGTTWNKLQVSGGGNFSISGSNPVAYGNGLWIMWVGTNLIAHSTDNALTWTVSSHTVDGQTTRHYGMRAIVYGPSGWIAGSAGEDGSTGFLIVSEDGYTWTYPNSSYKDLFEYSVYDVLYANGYYVAQGANQIASATIPMDTEVLTPSVKIVGIATATFTPTGIASNQGTIAYQWYKAGVGPLSDVGQTLIGSATTTLIISPPVTPDDEGEYYFTAEYVPTYSGVGDPRIGSGYRTGNAPNEPIQSENGKLSVIPLIEIISQPSSVQIEPDQEVTFNVVATLTDNRYTDDLQYQWVIDGVEVNDGTFAVDGASSTQTVEQTLVADGTITIPDAATDVRITLASGSGGNGATAGADSNPDVAEGYWGLGGAGRIGVFRLLSTAVQRTLSFRIGMQANDGSSGNVGNNQIGNWDTLTNSPGQGGGLGGHSTFAPGGNGGPSAFVTATAWGGGGGGGGGATTLRDPAIVVQPSHDYMAIAGAGAGAAGGIINAGSTGGVSGGSVTARHALTGDGLSFIYGEMDSLITSWAGHPGGQNLAGGGTGGGGGGSQLPYFIDPTVTAPNRFPIQDFIGGAGGVIHEPGSAVSYPGNAGISAYDTTQLELESESTNIGNGYAHVSYVGEGDFTTRNMEVSGSKTPTLTISSDTVGVSSVRCKISSAIAGNSPQYTNMVNYAVLGQTEDAILCIEEINNNPTANLVEANLRNGPYTFSTGDLNNHSSETIHTYVLYAKGNYGGNKDLEVDIDLYGGMGTPAVRRSVTGGETFTTPGAEGGYSRVRLIMKQGREYVITGLIAGVNTPFLYEMGRLIAVVGEGGHEGGGMGGGVGFAGETLLGSDGAAGGPSGLQLETNGIFGSNFVSPLLQGNQNALGGAAGSGAEMTLGFAVAGDTQATGRNGGRALRCTKGVWWASQAVDPCGQNPPGYYPSGDLHSGYFRLPNGIEVTNTSNGLARGFKSGYNIMQTAGAGEPMRVDFWGSHAVAGGRGGNGAWGGQGGIVNQGGGGGSGFAVESDFDPWNPPAVGGLKVISSQRGGSTFTHARAVVTLVRVIED